VFPAWSRRGRGGTVRPVSSPAVEVLPRRPHASSLLRALHARIRAQDPRVDAVSETQVAAVVGGVNRVMLSHVLGGDPRPLTALEPELVAFVRRSLASVEAPSRARPAAA
jgi:hypothetical protein